MKHAICRDGEVINVVSDATLAAEAKRIRVQRNSPFARDRRCDLGNQS